MAENYRSYVSRLLAGVRWAAGYYGSRLTVGFFGLLADLVAEGTREANHARFTRYSHDDALGEIGNTRDIQRYYNDTPIQFRSRSARAFELHAEDGTDIAVEKALGEFGFPDAVVYEDWEWHRPPQPWWSQGWIYFPAGSHSVAKTSVTYGDGTTYGTGTLYGVVGITAGEVDGLRRLVKRRKRAAFIFREFIFGLYDGLGNAVPHYGTGVLYGGGSFYGSPTSQVIIGAE